jgi:DNA invertase Pin-like site-specific DNA recombinase
MESQLSVAGYYRVSKAREGMNSPELYEEQIRRYCDYRGFNLARVYADIDHSGYNNSRARPALKELCDKRRKYAAVVVPKLSRFGRSMAHLFEMYTSFSEDGVDLIFLDIGVDSSTSQGKLLRNVMSAFAEYESDVRSDYAKTNAEHAARLGRPNGMAPFGYRYRGKGLGLEVVEDKARIVRHIFSSYTKGEPILAIARKLDAAGHRSPRGKRWNPDSVRKVLDNPAFVGQRRHHDQLFKATWQPIISKTTWDRTLARRAAARARSYPKARGTPRLLTGLIKCGVCGRNIHYHRGYGTKHPDHYACAGAAGAAQYFHNPCKGGAVTARRAEELVVTAVMSSAPAVLRSEIAALYSNLRSERYWADATTAERREVLATVIDKVVLIPRPEGTVHGKGQPRDRELRLIWKPEFVGPHGDQDAVSLLLPDPQSSSKVCEECGLRKQLIDFPKNGHRPDRRGPVCHRCRGREGRRTVSLPDSPPEPPPAPEPVSVNPASLPWNEFQRHNIAQRDRWSG